MILSRRLRFWVRKNHSRWAFVLTCRPDRLLRSSDWKSDLCRFIDVFDYHFRFLDRTILVLCTITVKDAAQVTLETNNRVNEIKSYFEQAGAGPYRKAGGQGGPGSLALNMPEEMWEEVGSDHQSSVADIVRSNAEIFDKKFALQKDALRRPSNHTMLSVSIGSSSQTFLLT